MWLLLNKFQIYFFFFRKLGDEWSITQEVTDDIEAFTCLMYGCAREKSVNDVRSIMLKQMVGENEQLTTKSRVDLSRLPPCRDNLVPHLGRVNYRLASFKRANEPIFWSPKPYDNGQGWEKNEEGLLEPMWSCGPILPPSLVDLLDNTNEGLHEDEEEEREEEIDFDELFNDYD